MVELKCKKIEEENKQIKNALLKKKKNLQVNLF